MKVVLRLRPGQHVGAKMCFRPCKTNANAKSDGYRLWTQHDELLRHIVLSSPTSRDMSQTTQSHTFTIHKGSKPKPKLLHKGVLGIQVDGLKASALSWKGKKAEDEFEGWGLFKGYAYPGNESETNEVVIGIKIVAQVR